MAQSSQPGYRPRCGGQPDHHGVCHRHACRPGLDDPGDRKTLENISKYGQKAHFRGHAEIERGEPKRPEKIYAFIGGTAPGKGFGRHPFWGSKWVMVFHFSFLYNRSAVMEPPPKPAAEPAVSNAGREAMEIYKISLDKWGAIPHNQTDRQDKSVLFCCSEQIHIT